MPVCILEHGYMRSGLLGARPGYKFSAGFVVLE